MSDKIHVQRVSSFGTGEWRAVRSDGHLLFEIRLQISAMLNGSRYFVMSPRGEVVRHGSFHFETWDYPTIRQVLTAIVTAVVPDSEVDVELEVPQRASGT
ncbi:MAG TPA: hypothetical protein VHN14_03430 [Kofleriaceae bacterium]|jgi:hypothetical protein|nr:hypothetical protein [Kofleriaceae bacterium]